MGNRRRRRRRGGRVWLWASGVLVLLVAAAWTWPAWASPTCPLLSVWGVEVNAAAGDTAALGGSAAGIAPSPETAPSLETVPSPETTTPASVPPPQVDAARQLARVAGRPWNWRWAAAYVLVRRDRFLRTVVSSVQAPWHVPFALSSDLPQPFRVVQSRHDGALQLDVAGRVGWLRPGQVWSLARAEGHDPVWADLQPAAWRRTISGALAAKQPVRIWRIRNYGRWPRTGLLTRRTGAGA